MYRDQMFGPNGAATSANEGAFNDVAQFTDVSGEGLVLQQTQCLRVDPRRSETHVCGEFLREVTRQCRDIGLSFAKGGDLYRVGSYSIVEVRTELSFFNLYHEVGVRRGDNPDIDGMSNRASDRRHRTVFEHAQQLGLHISGHVSDLIQK